jgi:hypothetical protein
MGEFLAIWRRLPLIHRIAEKGSSRKPGFQCISVPEISFREELPSPQRRAAA